MFYSLKKAPVNIGMAWNISPQVTEGEMVLSPWKKLADNDVTR